MVKIRCDVCALRRSLLPTEKRGTRMKNVQATAAQQIPIISYLSFDGSRRAVAEAGGPSSGEGAGPLKMWTSHTLGLARAGERKMRTEARLQDKYIFRESHSVSFGALLLT